MVFRRSEKRRSPPGMPEEMKRYRNCCCNVFVFGAATDDLKANMIHVFAEIVQTERLVCVCALLRKTVG